MKQLVIGLWLGLCSLACLAGNAGDYQLGGGDVVKVAVYDNVDLNTEAMLSTDGELNLPLLGRVHLGGLTVDQAESQIADQLRAGGYVKKPQVTLVVSQYRSQKISAIGEFNHPGMILLDQPTDLFSVIAQAGGVATTGGDTVVLIHGATRTSYSINQLMAQDDAQNRSIMVGGGDVIFIPRSLVFVNGEVNHPGGFRLEAGMTVLQAISEAGGFTSKASQSSVVIHRNQTDGVHVINAKLSDPLLVGDVVDVSQSWF